MATKFSTQVTSNEDPKSVHAGVNSRYGRFALSASLSAGDVIQMVKVPTGARIIDGWLKAQLTSANTVTIEMGDSDDTDRFVSAASASDNTTIIRFTNVAGFGHKYSISDDNATKFETIDVNVTAVTSSTATGTLEMYVKYAMDDPN